MVPAAPSCVQVKRKLRRVEGKLQLWEEKQQLTLGQSTGRPKRRITHTDFNLNFTRDVTTG